MHLVEDHVFARTVCSACGAVQWRGRMVRVPEDHRLWFCSLGCAADYSFRPRADGPE